MSRNSAVKQAKSNVTEQADRQMRVGVSVNYS